MPTHYTSLLTASATCVVFLYGFVRVGSRTPVRCSLGRMAAAVMLLVSGLPADRRVPGFSILLAAAVLAAIYGLFDPGFGARPPASWETNEMYHDWLDRMGRAPGTARRRHEGGHRLGAGCELRVPERRGVESIAEFCALADLAAADPAFFDGPD